MCPRNRHREAHVVSHHAGYRLATRYEMDRGELESRVREGDFEYKKRLTTRRSLCRCLTAQGPMWFILDRPRGQVITVLAEDQAAELM